MAVSGLHRQVASVALAAAAQHGFALGGGNALLAHGLTTRPTQDVDLFTDQKHGVEAAAAAVERALAAAGLQAERQDDTAGLADLFPGMGQDDEFFRYRLSQQDVDALRAKFAAWPRTPQALTREVPGWLRQPDTAPELRSGPQRDDPELGQ
jgi:hypothetical protein